MSRFCQQFVLIPLFTLVAGLCLTGGSKADLNSWKRYHGWGWSDGYHSAHNWCGGCQVQCTACGPMVVSTWPQAESYMPPASTSVAQPAYGIHRYRRKPTEKPPQQFREPIAPGVEPAPAPLPTPQQLRSTSFGGGWRTPPMRTSRPSPAPRSLPPRW